MRTTESFEDYIDRLEELGIECIGEGAYACVFQHPTLKNIVVKVFKTKDVEFAKYLKFCRTHQHNPYVPKIYGHHRSSTEYEIVFLERLKRVRVWQAVSRLVSKQFTLTKEQAKNLKSAFMMPEPETFRELNKLVKSRAANPDFEEFWNHIRTHGPRRLDFHPGNMMLRGKQLVFTDPVGHTPTHFRYGWNS